MVIGSLLSISSVVAALQLGTQWYLPLGMLFFLGVQGLGTIVCVVARGLQKPDALVSLDRAIQVAGVLICLSVVSAHIGYAYGWKFGEVQQSWSGIRSFGPLGDGVAWLVALFLARWWLCGARGWCILGGAALALTGSIGPLVALCLSIIALMVLDAWRYSGRGFLSIWKRRAIIATWVGFGMIIASFQLPDFASDGQAEQLARLPRHSGVTIQVTRLLPSRHQGDDHTSNASWSANERLGNILISFDLVRHHWLLGTGYGSTSLRFQEVPWRAYVPTDFVERYEQGIWKPYAVNAWIQLAVSGGLVAFGVGLWIWVRFVVATHRRIDFWSEPRDAVDNWSFMWVLLAGFMLTSDWLLAFNLTFQLICIGIAIAQVHGSTVLPLSINLTASASENPDCAPALGRA